MPVRGAESKVGDCSTLGSRDMAWTERRGLGEVGFR